MLDEDTHLHSLMGQIMGDIGLNQSDSLELIQAICRHLRTSNWDAVAEEINCINPEEAKLILEEDRYLRSRFEIKSYATDLPLCE